MTEVSCPISADGWNLVNNQSCGRPRPGVTARIVDENDEPLPAGKTGELVLRADNPWGVQPGLLAEPPPPRRRLGATSGCIPAMDFNLTPTAISISSTGSRIACGGAARTSRHSRWRFEVDAHPAILESAAVAVPSDLSEDELKVVAALKPGCTVETRRPARLPEDPPARLHGATLPRNPRRRTCPKTPTGKVQKVLLRATGTAGAWDREG